MDAIRFDIKECSEEQLHRIAHLCKGDEVRIYQKSRLPLLPIEQNGETQLLPWGSQKGELPKTGLCRIEALQQGKWRQLNPVEVPIPASSALCNGVWFHVQRAIQGILVYDEEEQPHVYMLTQPSTHYFRTMTGAERMPVLLGQTL